MTKKIIIGLTGGFSSGKSTTRNIFKELGAKTFDCDQAAHDSLNKKEPTYQKIVKLFGTKILNSQGAIDRKILGEIVFSNKRKKAQLEKIIHPYVHKKMLEFIENKTGVLVVEVPLLFESNLLKHFDHTIVVYTPQKEILKRAKFRFPYLSQKEILNRIKQQIPLNKKKTLADFVIKNDSPKSVVKQINQLLTTFEEKIN